MYLKDHKHIDDHIYEIKMILSEIPTDKRRYGTPLPDFILHHLNSIQDILKGEYKYERDKFD